MSEPPIPAATLKLKEDRRLLRGHLWAYRNEFAALPEVPDGAILDVYAYNRRFVGRGFYQTTGGIAVRIMTHHQETIDQELFVRRLNQAQTLRRQQFPRSTVYRWVYGESDGMPGLVVDRYDSVAVVHSVCAFYQKHQEMLVNALRQFDGVVSVLWRHNDTVHWEGEAVEHVSLDLDGVRAALSFIDAQKTGLFLDQRCNWPLVRKYAVNASVLDGYCYHGLWSMHAALGGASQVLGVDTSAGAIACAQENSRLNGLSQCRFEAIDMEAALSRGRQYDVIILDPPAFAKNRSLEKRAMARYERINRIALQGLNRNGVLISCSCSHFVSSDAFLEMLKRAAARAGTRLQLLELGGASPDHPVLLSMPETAYLKCAVLRRL